MSKLLILNGPNLNLLGSREPEIYGRERLHDIENALIAIATPHQLSCFQSNAEHALIDAIHKAKEDNIAGIVFNPAAFSHTSIALRDALLAVAIPFVEVHLSNVFSRETFRHHSYFSDIALGVISGLGRKSYEYGLRYLIEFIESN